MDKRKVAREARKLAMECVTGEAPPLIQWMLCSESHGRKRYCVAGLLAHRACGDIYSVIDRLHDLPEVDILVTANNEASDADRHGAVVFPLLALADACDEAAASESERA